MFAQQTNVKTGQNPVGLLKWSETAAGVQFQYTV